MPGITHHFCRGDRSARQPEARPVDKEDQGAAIRPIGQRPRSAAGAILSANFCCFGSHFDANNRCHADGDRDQMPFITRIIFWSW